MRFDEELKRNDTFSSLPERRRRRSRQAVPPEDELRVPPMPKTNETTTTKTKKLADIAPPQANLERSSEKTLRSTQVSDYLADTGGGFSGGGRSFSDSTPKSPESELRIPPTPQTKATAEITAKPKAYDGESPALERSSERAPRSTQRSAYSADSDRGFTGGGRRLPDLSLAPDDALAKTRRPEAYTEGNVLQYLDRAAALASLPEWTEGQRAEAKELYDLLQPKGLANGGTLSSVWNDTMYSFTKDSDRYSPSLGYRLQTGELQDEWQPTYAQLAYKTHPQESGFAVGLSKGTGATSISNAIYNGLEKSGVDVSEQRQAMKLFDDVEQHAKKNTPIAYAAGEITGNVALLLSLSKLIAVVPGFAELPGIAQSILSGVGTLGTATAVQELGDVSGGKITKGKYAADIGVNALGGAVGGALSNALPQAGSRFLEKTGLQTNALAKTVVGGLSGTGFALGNTGTKMLAGKLGYPEGASISSGQLVQDVIVGFAFGALLSQTQTGNKSTASKQGKTQWQYFNENMPADQAHTLYRQLSMTNHPDVGGSNEVMSAINAEYARYCNALVQQTATAYTTAVHAGAEGNTDAASRAIAVFSRNVPIIQAMASDGVLTGVEATAALDVLTKIQKHGVLVPENSVANDTLQAYNQDAQTAPKRTAEDYAARGREMILYSGGEDYRTIEAESLAAAGEASKNPLARAMATQVRTQLQNGVKVSNETLGRFEDVLKSSATQSAMDTEQAMFILSQELLGENAPATFEEFQAIKDSDPAKWEELSKNYKAVSQYKIDSGNVRVAEIIDLDQRILNEKRSNFNKRCTYSGNVAAAYLDDDPKNLFIAHSGINSDKTTENYSGSAILVSLKQDRRFSYIDVIKADGSIRTSTWYDTEAKLFEEFAERYEKHPFSTITMISERGMCHSCANVMNQFKTMFPNVRINVISNVQTEGNVWKHR